MAIINGTLSLGCLTGTTDSDRILGFGGSETISATNGNNFIDASDGFDTVDYRSLPGTITLKPFGGIDKGGFGIDTLFLVERIVAAPGRANTIDVSSFGTAMLCRGIDVIFSNGNYSAEEWGMWERS